MDSKFSLSFNIETSTELRKIARAVNFSTEKENAGMEINFKSIF